jgi:hypothetical protein
MAKKAKVRASRAQRGAATAAIPETDLARWLPSVLFGALTLWVFRDFVFSDRMLLGGDTLSLGYVARAFYAQALKGPTGFPLWNPQILGGTPFLEALSGGDSLYPPSALLLMLLEPYRALGWKLVLHVLAAGFFMFGWTRAIGASRPAALVAGVGYLLSPMLVSFVRPGHDGKLFVMALAPLLFWAVERHFVRPRPGTFAGIGLVVTLVMLTTHFQMAYFLFGAVGAFALFRAFQVGRRGEGEGTRVDVARPAGAKAAGLRFATFLAASLAGAAGSAVQFVPAVGYVTEYSRRVQTTAEHVGETGRAWSSSWSLHPEEAMGLLIPEFAGNNAGGAAWSSGTYWGRNVTRDNLPAPGVVLLVLAAVSFAGGARRALRWFLAGLGAVALLFALGTHTPVWGLFYALVPGIRLFRAPDMVMFLLVFATATLAALGVDRLLWAAHRDQEAPWKRPGHVLLGATALLAALALLASSGALLSFWTSVVYPGADPGLVARAQPLVARGAFISAALVAALTGVTFAVRRAVLAPTALVAGLVLLVALDPMRVDDSFVQTLSFQEWSRPDPNIRAVLEREDASTEPYRLISFAQGGQDVTPAMHGIELAGGHHPNDLARYRELIGMVGSGMPENLFDPKIRSLLNVRYLLWPDYEAGGSLQGDPISRTELQNGQPYQSLYAEPGLARARLVAEAVVRPDSAAVSYMLSQAFDPASQVVLSEPSPVSLNGGPVSGTVRWEARGPNRLRLRVTSDRPALLVIADNWFPAWHASVDGESAAVLRAYHTLRAVPVGAGEHTVEMWYRSGTLVRSFWLSLVVVGALLAVWGTSLVRQRGRQA